MSKYSDKFIMAYNHVQKNEGGDKYHEIAGDSGGATKYGISLKFLKTINADATNDNIKNLDNETAMAIYHEHFWLKSRAEEISDIPLACEYFDVCVNRGEHGGAKLLQSACNNVGERYGIKLTIDGNIGDKSLAAINEIIPRELLTEFINIQIAAYREIVQKNPSQAKFLNGWLARATRTIND